MLSIIILNYNNIFHIKNCLFSLERQTYKNFEVILIDNNSKDPYRKELHEFLKSSSLDEEFMKKIRFIQSYKNLGFTGGNNLGINKSKGDMILLLNNDTFHEPIFLESMITFFEKYKSIHIAQPTICFYPRKDLIWGRGGKIKKFSYHLFSHINYLEKDNYLLEEPIKIDYAIGCALFIRTHILKEIGLLDNSYFMYSDDPDLCYRARLNGFKNIYCNPKSRIYHNYHFGQSVSYKRFYYRSRMIFVVKFFPFPLIIWQFFMQFILLFISIFNLKEKNVDYDLLFKSIKGTVDGFKTGIIIRIMRKKIK